MWQKLLDQTGNVLRVLSLAVLAFVLQRTYLDRYLGIWISVGQFIDIVLPIGLLATVAWYLDIILSLQVIQSHWRKASITLGIAFIIMLATLLLLDWACPIVAWASLCHRIGMILGYGMATCFFPLQAIAVHTIVKRVYNSPKYLLLDYILAFFNLNLVPFGIWFYQSEIDKHKRHLRKGGFVADINEIGKPTS